MPAANIVQESPPVDTAPKPKPNRKRKGGRVTKKKLFKVPKNPPAPNAAKPKKVIKSNKPKKLIIKRGPRTTKKVGISNNGNNCFMNAVWQSLR